MATKNNKQVFKLYYSIVTIVLIAGLLSMAERTAWLAWDPLPHSVAVAIKFVLSTNGFVWLALISLTFALLYRVLINNYYWRRKLRPAYYLIVSIFVAKLYSWAGVLFGMALMAVLIPYIQFDPLFVAYGFGCWACGLMAWLLFRQLALRTKQGAW